MHFADTCGGVHSVGEHKMTRLANSFITASNNWIAGRVVIQHLWKLSKYELTICQGYSSVIAYIFIFLH
jgi:hypothetical protein